ncbi:MAG: LysR family transcriptional regulator [Pigmentiphaga sp.]
MLISDIHAFLAVAKTKSFSAAAVRLRIAQSSLSARVQRLEQHLGIELFIRHGRGVSLTEAGAVLLSRAESLVREIEDIESNVKSVVSAPTGTVRIAMPPATGPVLAPRVFARCVSDFPAIKLQLRESTTDVLHRWLADGDVDLALTYAPESGPDFAVRPLLTEPLYLISPSDAKARAMLKLPELNQCAMDDLAWLPLVLPRSPHSVRIIVDRLCAGNRIQPNVLYESDSIRSTKSLVQRGYGCTIFSAGPLREDLAAGRLIATPFSSPLMSWTLALVHPRRDHLSLAVRSVKRLIIDQVAVMHQEAFWPDARLRVAETDGE